LLALILFSLKQALLALISLLQTSALKTQNQMPMYAITAISVASLLFPSKQALFALPKRRTYSPFLNQALLALILSPTSLCINMPYNKSKKGTLALFP
jgi:hypothetical protein